MAAVESYLLLFFAWVLWCTLHSLLICIPVTNYLERLLGVNFRFFRLVYNVISVVTLLVPVYFSLSVQQHEAPLVGWPEILEMVRLLLIGVALLLFVSGAKEYSMSSFLGVSQLRTRQSQQLLSDQLVFRVSGVSAVTRHPWYLGGILITWSAPSVFFPSTILTALIITGYFLLGTIFEERKLVHSFGASYRDYQRQVSMLIPLKWIKSLSLRRKI